MTSSWAGLVVEVVVGLCLKKPCFPLRHVFVQLLWEPGPPVFLLQREAYCQLYDIFCSYLEAGAPLSVVVSGLGLLLWFFHQGACRAGIPSLVSRGCSFLVVCPCDLVCVPWGSGSF